MDISKISYNDHTLFHMLRHFECINENARQCLLLRGYSHAQIDANLAIPGSKFHSHFATDLKTLVAQFEGREIVQINSLGKYDEYEISFNPSEFAQGIGTRALVHFNELESIGATRIIEKPNRGLLLKHAFVQSIPNDWELTFVLKHQQNYELLITAFPGKPTLPFPKLGLKKELFESRSKFWEEHIFLEIGGIET